MAKVFVVNKGIHDYSPAAEFGELVFLSERSMNRFDLSKMWREFEPILHDSSPEDYIVPSGLTNMTVVATTIFVNLHKRLNILTFKGKKNSPKGSYVAETLIFGGNDGRHFELDSPVCALRMARKPLVQGRKEK